MALEIVFWVSVGLIVYAHVGYPLLLGLLVSLRGNRHRAHSSLESLVGDPPTVSLIIPAYDEERVIERKLANARALDYPADRLQVIVASDGSTDRTAELARAAGADL